MPVSKDVFVKRFMDFSVEDLEREYDDLRENFEFETKEDYIKNVIDNYLNVSYRHNCTNKKNALEYVLEKKTGKKYSMNILNYKVSFEDVVRYDTKNDVYWERIILRFFKAIPNVSANDRIQFLLMLFQERNIYNEFTKEINQKMYDPMKVYEKYYDQIRRYCASHSIKG